MDLCTIVVFHHPFTPTPNSCFVLTCCRTPCPPSHFVKSHGQLCSDISAIARRVQSDEQLREQISYKYRMKNTVGLSLNALVDFDPGGRRAGGGGRRA